MHTLVFSFLSPCAPFPRGTAWSGWERLCTTRGRTRRIKVHCHWDVLAGTVLSGSRVNQRGAQQHLCVTEQEQPAASTRRAAHSPTTEHSLWWCSYSRLSLFTNGRWFVQCIGEMHLIYTPLDNVLLPLECISGYWLAWAPSVRWMQEMDQAARSPSSLESTHIHTLSVSMTVYLEPLCWLKTWQESQHKDDSPFLL
jgi:hypothetical protein